MSFTKNDQAVVLNRESLQYLANCIRLVHSLPDLLNDVLPSQTTTYSSYKVTELLNTLNTDLQNYVNNALGNLSHLKKEIVSVAPTDSSADEDTIYLVQDASGGYEQYLKINGVVTSLGSTSVINNVYTKTESDAKFALLSTLNSLITVVGGLNDLTTTDKTSIVDAINELKTELTTHTNDTDIHITSAERTLWNTVSDKADTSQIHTHSNKSVLDEITEANVKTMNDIASGIGGRNYIRKDINNISKWYLKTPERLSISNVEYDNTLIYKTTGSGWEIAMSDGITVIPKKEYVLSFEYEVFNNYSYLEGETFRVEVLSEKVMDSFSKEKAIAFHTIENVVTPKKRVYITFTPTTSTIYLMINGGYIEDGLQNLKFSFNKFKLEKGSIPTDWTPAPEDTPTNFVTTIDSTSTNTQVPTAKSVWDSLYKLCNTQVLVDANKPTSKMCMADLTTLNTPSKEGMTGAQSSLIISIEGRDYWNGQISITMAEPSVFVRSVRDTGGWTKWRKLCSSSVTDVGPTTITPTFPSTVTLGSTQMIYYSIKNGWANVSVILNLKASPKFTWTTIATGLPKPDKEINTSSFGETAVNNASVGFRLKPTGALEMLVGSEITQTDWWNVNVSYPVKES